MKRFYKLFACWVFVLLLVFSPSMQSHASLESLLIRTGSNALMTMELDDSDYGISLMSSFGSVLNTVDYSKMFMFADWIYADSGDYAYRSLVRPDSNGYFYMGQILENTEIMHIGFMLNNQSLPSPGSYLFSFDFTSDFAFDHLWHGSHIAKTFKNADSNVYEISFPIETSSGDAYLSPVSIKLPSLDNFNLFSGVESGLYNFGGYIDINFTRYSGECTYDLQGADTSVTDYQNDVSSNLSDLSSSVGDLDDSIGEVEAGIDEVTSAIQNLQGAMEPHYANVLTQLHHITEQLHALWDQQFNLHHVPLMTKLGEIKDAISNMDLEVVVELDELKQTVNNMSQAIQNKLQSVQDGINSKLQSVQDTLTGGYNSGGINSENDELSGAVDGLDQAEQEVLDDVNGYLEDFEYPSVESMPGGVIAALSFFGTYLQSVFVNMGDFNVIITFSLTMIFVLIIIGYHRIRT